MHTSSTNTPIAIVGAGPGGLTAARVLQRHGVDVTVYDLDASPDARPQGGTLDMHADSGQVALAAAGLTDRFQALSRPEGQQMRVLDNDATVLSDAMLGEPGDAPEIDRGQLRTLLLDSLAPGTVRWEHAVSRLDNAGDGTWRVHFTGGGHADHDLVIGADGAWSRVRVPLSAAVPEYTGVTFVEAHFDDVDARHPRQAALTGEGTMFAVHDNRGLVAQRNSGGHIRVYIAMRSPLDWHETAGVDLADTQAVRDALCGAFAGWDLGLLGFVTDNDGPYANRPLYALPVPHSWPHTCGLTLLGDAAHLMSPFGGQGANLAMLDGADLAQAIGAGGDLDTAVRAYEQHMLPRAAEAARGAADGLDRAIAPGAPGAVEEHLTGSR